MKNLNSDLIGGGDYGRDGKKKGQKRKSTQTTYARTGTGYQGKKF